LRISRDKEPFSSQRLVKEGLVRRSSMCDVMVEIVGSLRERSEGGRDV
jgi:hypothetical protein